MDLFKVARGLVDAHLSTEPPSICIQQYTRPCLEELTVSRDYYSMTLVSYSKPVEALNGEVIYVFRLTSETIRIIGEVSKQIHALPIH